MAQQIIDVGAVPNDGEGDPIRTAFIKTNDNFTELFAGGASTNIANGTSNVNVEASANVTVGVAGNTITTFATTGLYTNGIISASGNVQAGNVRTTGLVSASGNVFSGSALRTTGVISASGNIITAGYFVGNFFGNVTGNFVVPGSNTQVIFNSSGNAQATAGFTFDSDTNTVATTGVVSAIGNIDGGNIQTTGLITATGNIISSANISAGNVLVSGLISATSTVTSAANITGGNVLTGGRVSATGNVTGNYILGNGSQLTGLPELYGNSNVSNFLAAFGTNAISTTGNVTSGNIFVSGITSIAGNIQANYFFGNGSQLTGVQVGPSTHIVNGTSNVAIVSSGGNVTANVNGTSNVVVLASTGQYITGLISASGNIVSSGNIAGGNLSASGSFTVNSADGATAIVNGGSNAVGNIGSSSRYFNTVFAQATTALYADLAEMYLSDASYIPGTVVSFGGDKEITVSTQDADTRVAGVISTRPAYRMNSSLEGKYALPVALMGRVPCSVVGTVSRGDMMVSAGNGAARSESNPAMGTVIGKALEDFDVDRGVIEVVVGRL